MARHGTTALTVATRRRLQVLDALAKERLLDVHYRYALELVDHAAREIEPGRAFDIYARLHHLPGADADHLFQKVLVTIGRRSPPKPFEGDPEEGETIVETPHSIVAQIRRRLRGRQNMELREWIEFHTGRAETELLWTHVENARGFVELLEPFIGIGQAVGTYGFNLGVADGRAEIIYYLVLAHMSAGSTPTAPEYASNGGRLTLVTREVPGRDPRPSPRADPHRRGAGGVGR